MSKQVAKTQVTGIQPTWIPIKQSTIIGSMIIAHDDDTANWDRQLP